LTSSPARIKIEPDVVEDEIKPQSDIYSTLKASFDTVASLQANAKSLKQYQQ
jgi:hypothetical protein